VAFTGNSALLGTFGTPVTYDVPTAGTIVSGTNIDPHNLSYRRTAQRICQVSDLFRAVWGNTAMNTRIRCVYANQAQGPGQLLNGLTMINAALPHPPAYYLYAIAGAPYFFPSSSATTASYTSAQIITDIYTKNDNPGNNATINDTPYQVGNATFFALPGGYFSYEFGFENGANTVNRANRDAAMTATAATLGLAYDMGTITVDLYSQLYAQGATLQMQFTAGARGVGDGIYYPTNQDSALAACVRLNAIDTVKANGPGTPTAVAAVTLGTAVLAKTCYNLTQTGDFSLQLPYGFPHEAFWLFYLNPTNAGARNLIFNTSSGNAACTYNFYVDNVLVGGNISMPTGNTASMSFTLTGGLHAIRALPTANPSGVNLHSWTLS
jgi:hypothetical protein